MIFRVYVGIAALSMLVDLILSIGNWITSEQYANLTIRTFASVVFVVLSCHALTGGWPWDNKEAGK